MKKKGLAPVFLDLVSGVFVWAYCLSTGSHRQMEE